MLVCLLVLLLTHAVSSEFLMWQNDSIALTFGYGVRNTSFIGPTSNDTLKMSGYKLNITAAANGPIYKETNATKGHFHLKFYIETASYGTLSGTTDSCIPLTSTQDEVRSEVSDTILSNIADGVTYEYALSDILSTVKVQKFRNVASSTDFTMTFIITLDGDEMKDLVMYMRTAACDTPRTVGDWSDATKWDSGVVPTEADKVWLPEAAGVILLDSTQNVTVSGLTTNGGHIIGHHSVCPYGWNSNPTNNPSKKCYRMFEEPKNFGDAENYCRTNLGLGSMDSHLVQIADAGELLVTQRLCRGQLDTITTFEGCWIGLSDPDGVGKYAWIQPETVTNNTFRDWQRYMKNNHTFSEGESTNGELCVHMKPWQKNSLIREEGSFNDASCNLTKPFVCQMFGTTRRSTITVLGESHLSGGGIEGGNIDLYGSSYIENFYAHDSAAIFVNAPNISLTDIGNSTVLDPVRGYYTFENYTNRITTLVLEEGSSLHLNANVSSTNYTYIGEVKDLGNATDKLGMQSYLYIAEGVTWTIPGINLQNLTADSYYWTNLTVPMINSTTTTSFNATTNVTTSVTTNTTYYEVGNYSFRAYPDNSTWDYVDFPYDVIINARSTIFGEVDVGEGVRFNLNQGGAISESSVILRGNNTYLNLGGGSQLSTYDAYELKLQHRGPVIGEYQNSISYETPEVTTGDYSHVGVYKLSFTGQRLAGATETHTTQCIGYGATAEELAYILNELDIVTERGSATVRRYGNGEDVNFGYGYTHRIEIDAPPTVAFEYGSLLLTINCYGIHDCGCAETIVPLTDATGQRMCPRKEGNSSRVNADGCVTPPIITVSEVSRLSYTKTAGKGSIVIIDGAHRLPPIANVRVESASLGLGVVGADYIYWGGIAVDGVGTIICTGTGWASWDAASVLWGPPDWDVRGYVTMLESAPAFNMEVGNFRLAGRGSILTATVGSNMTWQSGVWEGGTVGGRSTLNIKGDITATGTNKAIRYGMTVFIDAASTLTWSSGDFSLANGAVIVVEGVFHMNTTQSGKQYIGEAHLLEGLLDDAADYADMLVTEEERGWHGYFGLEIDPELRGGWYPNPLVGDGSWYPNSMVGDGNNYMLVTENGVLSFSPNSSTSFNMPVNMLGSSRMSMGNNSYVELASGGICGNQVEVTVTNGTVFAFTGGKMSMRATCTVKGEGELLIAGGAHDMSFSIDAHITISGGYMIWPVTRGPSQTITFKGGLLIEGDGTLEIQPYSTNIIVYGEVIFRDQCLLQFPMMGIAAQPSNSDRPDAPDSTPRGTLTAVDSMLWEGGTLRGKADFIAQNTLVMTGGVKKIRSLAKLVNNGTAEWDTGDIIMADNADFMNLGTVKMRGGQMYFDASDLYEGSVVPTESGGDMFALDFHSYDIDSGKLSYVTYIEQRTQFVSRTPDDWDESDQDNTVQTPRNII